MRYRFLTCVLVVLSLLNAMPSAAQSQRPSRAACEAAVRAGLAALTQQPISVVNDVLDSWGTEDIAEALELPAGCRLPAWAPAVEPLDDGTIALYLMWNPRTGELGELLPNEWEAGWWECIPPVS
jgi:hypothetical protein